MVSAIIICVLAALILAFNFFGPRVISRLRGTDGLEHRQLIALKLSTFAAAAVLFIILMLTR